MLARIHGPRVRSWGREDTLEKTVGGAGAEGSATP